MGPSAEIQITCNEINHCFEVLGIPKSACSALDVLNDAVEPFQQRIGAAVRPIVQDPFPVVALDVILT